jgi:RimJ/RimL family protein N-acetyltransferase
MISAANYRSIRVAERLGFEPIRKDLLLEDPVVVYAIDRGTWRACSP